MKLQFSALNEQGKRENNEDNYYPQPDNNDNAKNLYMVCDGVGGADKGEVASNIACSAIAEYFKRNKSEEVNDSFVQSAIMQAELGMRKYVELNPDSRGMATTLTLLYFDKDQAVVAHCGDSRVYHVRNGEIISKTYDHSLVNELLATGVIKTEEEARNHPRKNVITRALSAGKEHSIADVSFVSDVQKGDLFLLCTDGVLESVDDNAIKELLVEGKTPEEIIDAIDKLCLENSNDNYSAIVVLTLEDYAVSKATTIVKPAQPATTENQTSPEDVIVINKKKVGSKTESTKKPKGLLYLIVALGLIMAAYAGWKFLPLMDDSKKAEKNSVRKSNEPEKEMDKKQKNFEEAEQPKLEIKQEQKTDLNREQIKPERASVKPKSTNASVNKNDTANRKANSKEVHNALSNKELKSTEVKKLETELEELKAKKNKTAQDSARLSEISKILVKVKS